MNADGPALANPAGTADLHDQHYLRSIADLAGRRKIVTHRPIFAENGMKLIDRGIHVSTSLHERLMRHKLLPPIDDCLSIEGTITTESLAASCDKLLAETVFGDLASTDTRRQAILNAIRHISLLPPLAFKLTVAQEQFPTVFRHSLEVAICAVLISLEAGDKLPKKLVDAAAAGLFHDLGLLHIDPAIRDKERVLSEQDRHHIYTHPVLSYLMLSKFPEYHPIVSQAILEHHERLDGSGYPRGLSDETTSNLGQLLAIAELTATLIANRCELPLDKHAHVVLRVNQGKFHRRYADAVMSLIPRPRSGSPRADCNLADYSQTLASLVALSGHIQHWQAISAHFGDLPLVARISARIDLLVRNLADVGIDLANWGMIDAELPQADEALQELAVAAHEGNWQFQAIIQEIERQWSTTRPENQRVQEQIWQWARQVDAG